MVADIALTASDLDNATDAERHLLAACLRSCEYDDGALDDVAAVVGAADFYGYAHQLVFKAMLELRSRSAPVSAATIYDHLRQRGELADLGQRPGQWFAELLELEPTGAAGLYFAARVKECSRLRALRRAAAEIVAETRRPGGTASDVGALCERILHEATADTATAGPRSVAELVAHELTEIDTRHERGAAGLPTGFREVDSLLCGMRPGQVVVIGARPSVGKSALALGIASNAAAAGVPVLFASLEMPNEELTQRLLAMRSGVRLHNIREGNLAPEQVDRITEAAGALRRHPLAFEDSPNMSADRAAATARRAVRRDGVKLVVVDYLQLMTPENPRENRNAQVGLMARRLKLLARELAIPVLVLCQLNRETENRPDPKPRLSDLRDSGEIEQHADIVLLLSPQRGPSDPSRTLIDCNVAKNRNGAKGEITLAYVGALTRFENVASV